MSSYEVLARRDGSWWTFEIPALSSPSPRGGGHRIIAMGQARSAPEIAGEARALAEMWTDEDGVNVHVVYVLDDDVREAIETARQRDAEGRAALDEAAALRRRAVRALRASGLTQTDAAAVLGVSRQRVQQLVH